LPILSTHRYAGNICGNGASALEEPGDCAMTVSLLLTLLIAATTEAAFLTELVESWQSAESQFSTLELSWQIVHDSRTADFGSSAADRPRTTWQLRVAGDRCRVDGERLTVVGRNQRLRPAESDPTRARLEFRYVLLEERLKGPQTVPLTQPLSVVFAKGAHSVPEFGELERLLAAAPLLATRPLFLIDPDRLTVTERKAVLLGRDLSVLVSERPEGRQWELWVEPDSPHRIHRIIEVQKTRAVGQIDFSYEGAASSIPTRWRVLRLDSEDNVIEFASAARERVLLDAAFADDVFELPAEATLGASGNVSRKWLRVALDWAWLACPIAVLLAVAIRFQLNGRARAAHYRLAGTILATLVALAAGAELRHTPIGDRPLIEYYDELTAVWDDTQRLQEAAADDPARQSLQRHLATLTADLEREQARSEGFSLWRLAYGRQRPAEMARADLIRAAKVDLPAMLHENTLDNGVRVGLIVERLARVGDHLAGISPYVPPLKPLTVTPASPPTPASDWSLSTPMTSTLLLLDIGIVAGFVVWWRQKRRMTPPATIQSAEHPVLDSPRASVASSKV
jgi:hypothetical protein